jgi:transcriptional regulator with XRE-family HTH domain
VEAGADGGAARFATSGRMQRGAQSGTISGENVNNSSLGTLIRERRRQLNLTQEEVARRIKTSVPFVGHLEANKRRPSEATITRLAEVLGFDRSDLFFRAYPQTKALLEHSASDDLTSAWEAFCKDQQLQQVHAVTPEEMEILGRVALMGHVRSVRDFIYILNSVRQALSE